jgi:hypoxanthine phosphoribosyltransferase
MHRDIQSVTYSEEDISKRVSELGEELSRDYAGKNPVFIGILKGGFVFLSDLARAVTVPVEIQFLRASSYGDGAVTSGSVDIAKDLSVSVEGRHVLIVEDILDTGMTLLRILELLRRQNPASLKICAFLDKRARRVTPISFDYVGYECEDAFFVGYGLDFAERYRNLPYIGVLKPEIYL